MSRLSQRNILQQKHTNTNQNQDNRTNKHTTNTKKRTPSPHTPQIPSRIHKMPKL